MFNTEIMKMFRRVRMRKARLDHDLEEFGEGRIHLSNSVINDLDIVGLTQTIIEPRECFFEYYPDLNGHFGLKLMNNWLKDILYLLKYVLDGEYPMDITELYNRAIHFMTYEETQKKYWSDYEIVNLLFDKIGKELADKTTMYSTGKYLTSGFDVSEVDINLMRIRVPGSYLERLVERFNDKLYDTDSIMRAIANLHRRCDETAHIISNDYPTASMKRRQDELAAQMKVAMEAFSSRWVRETVLCSGLK